jgi:hypothetical protein
MLLKSSRRILDGFGAMSMVLELLCSPKQLGMPMSKFMGVLDHSEIRAGHCGT